MPWTLAELAGICGGRVKGDPGHRIDGFAAADQAGPGKLAFVTGAAWLEKLSPGAAAIIPPGLENDVGDRQIIIADQPRLAFAIILNKVVEMDRPPAGIHASAVIETDAQIDPTASIGPLTYIGGSASIGARTTVHPQAYVGPNANIGSDCVLYPNCYIGPGCRLGDRVIIGPGASIGFDGFGYHWDGERHVKIPQVGIVVIEDDVEIGALSAVDRATLGETRVGKGTKFDNCVMVGHNCVIGRNAILVSQVGLSGRVVVGDGAVLAGQAGVREGVNIGPGAIVAGQAGVSKDVPAGKRVGGTPARSEIAWLRREANVEKISELRKRVKELEKKLDALEKGRDSGGKEK